MSKTAEQKPLTLVRTEPAIPSWKRWIYLCEFPWAAQLGKADPQSLLVDCVEGLGQVNEDWVEVHLLFNAFLLHLTVNTISTVLWPGLRLHWVSADCLLRCCWSSGWGWLGPGSFLQWTTVRHLSSCYNLLCCLCFCTRRQWWHPRIHPGMICFQVASGNGMESLESFKSCHLVNLCRKSIFSWCFASTCLTDGFFLCHPMLGGGQTHQLWDSVVSGPEQLVNSGGSIEETGKVFSPPFTDAAFVLQQGCSIRWEKEDGIKLWRFHTLL